MTRPPCPNKECFYYNSDQKVAKDGRYFRADDHRLIQRYKCAYCKKRYSQATWTFEYNQKKRRINSTVLKLLCVNTCQRDIARVLSISKDTVASKLKYLARKARYEHRLFLEQLKDSVVKLQFDDMIDKEHTKMKPLSITVAVEAKSRIFLGVKVSKIPAFGALAQKSRHKYGRRPNEHLQNAKELFASFAKTIKRDANTKRLK
jgi:transposase-like protein